MDHLNKQLSGGCSCGSIRYELTGPPLWISACHCNACKTRTGSAYGVSVVIEKAAVKSFSGVAKTFRRAGDSGRQVNYDFCPNCGSTVRWRIELMPDREIFAAGTLDQPIQIDVIGEYYTDDAWPWAQLNCDLACPAAPDNELRQALINKTKASRQSTASG
jgi:hypothetical protein